MKYILLLILIWLSIYPFFSLKKDKTRLYQLPCLFGLTTLGMIITPLIMNVFFVSGVSEDAFNLYVFNACLCLIAAYIGYSMPVKKISKANRYDEKKMLFIVSIYAIVCLLLNNKMNELSDGMYFTEGMPVVLKFFVRMLRPVTIIVMFLFLRKFSYYKLVLILILLGLNISGIIIQGRRSEVFMFIFVILFPLFFVKGFVPYKKKYLITAFVIGMVVFLLMPTWRYHNLSYYNDASALEEKADYAKALLEITDKEAANDVMHATYNVYAVLETGEYNYGAEFYNLLIFNFMSRTLLGEGVKEKLYVGKFGKDRMELLRSQVNYGEWGYFKRYLVWTGFADVFFIFGFGGCILFFFFARISKRMWYDAVYTDDIMYKVFYSYFAVMFICAAIYANISGLIVVLIQFLIVYLPVKYFSKIRK